MEKDNGLHGQKWTLTVHLMKTSIRSLFLLLGLLVTTSVKAETIGLNCKAWFEDAYGPHPRISEIKNDFASLGQERILFRLAPSLGRVMVMRRKNISGDVMSNDLGLTTLTDEYHFWMRDSREGVMTLEFWSISRINGDLKYKKEVYYDYDNGKFTLTYKGKCTVHDQGGTIF